MNTAVAGVLFIYWEIGKEVKEAEEHHIWLKRNLVPVE